MTSQYQVWLPQMGTMPFHVRQVANAIEEYDHRLSLGKDQNGDNWVVLRQDGPDGIPFFPVFDLGYELPSADDVKKELFKRDMARNGTRIVGAVVKAQNDRRAASRQHAQEGTTEAAKALAWYYKKQSGEGNAQIYVPRSI